MRQRVTRAPERNDRAGREEHQGDSDTEPDPGVAPVEPIVGVVTIVVGCDTGIASKSPRPMRRTKFRSSGSADETT